MIHWGLSSGHIEIQRWLYKGIMGRRTSDTLMCTHIYMPTQVHTLSLPWTKLAKLSARAALNDWSDYMLHSSRYHFHRKQHEFHCPPPEIVPCGGPWKKLDIILKARRSLLQRKQIQWLGWKFNRAPQDYLLAVQMDPKFCSQYTHTHMYTLYFLHLPFSFTQADLQELPFHTFVPPMDGEMPQQSRSRELVHGEWVPSSRLLRHSETV